MESKYLPGFDTAGPNGFYIDCPELPEELVLRNRANERVELPTQRASHDPALGLARKRAVAKVAAGISLESAHEALPENWDDLTERVYAASAVHINHYLADPSNQTAQINAAPLYRDTYGGAAQITAVFDVISRLLATTDMKDPNVELAARAQRSKGMMLHWAAVTDEADAGLIYGLAYPKPDLNAENPFKGLRFHTKWFEPYGEAVRLRPDKVPHLRSEQDKHPNYRARKSDIWFGCPARKHIPYLFDTMLELATEANLFGRTYHSERQQLGY